METNFDYGMDQTYWDWSPMIRRPVLEWPDQARLAVCLLVDLGHYEWRLPEAAYDPPTHTPPMALHSFPDYVTVTHREYGHRVGIFRIMQILDSHSIKATVPMDAYTARNYPSLVQECHSRDWEIIAHGLSQRQAITSRMSDDEESHYIAESIDAVHLATGKKPSGWLGPEHSQSARTPNILADMGITYCCDFPNDEQPFRVHTKSGELYALPCMIELGDTVGQHNRKLPLKRWATMVKEAYDVMWEDASESGLLLMFRIHPWCMGQPHKIKWFEEVISHMRSRKGVWLATGSEIVNWYRQQPHSKFRPRRYG